MHPYLTLTLIALGALLAHAAVCLVWPFSLCSHCKGSGARPSPSGKHHGVCRWCKGSPRKLRFGRRVIRWWFHK